MKSYTQPSDEIKASWVSLGEAVAAVLANRALAAFDDSSELLAAALDAGDYVIAASCILAHDLSRNLLSAEVGRLFAIAHLGRRVNEQDKAAITYLARVYLGEVRS